MSKVMGIFSNLGLFYSPAHQIWSCHVTQEANFENFLFCPNSTFNIRKSHKISSGKPLYFRSFQLKTSPGGGGDSPSTFSVRRAMSPAKVYCGNKLFTLVL